MKVTTFLGTRPEIIRLSRVIPLLDAHTRHRLVHTGQNFDSRLSDIFFEQLGVRQPDAYLGVRAESFGDQVAQILQRGERTLMEDRPDALLVLGDTNSGLISMVGRRMGIPVFHMEAGNRCYDDRVPEEINRRVIDQCSTVLMPYTQRSRENLVREGFRGNQIFVTGNPIGEVIAFHAAEVAASRVLEDLGLAERKYFLATIHRAENVDVESRLRRLLKALEELAADYAMPVVCSAHPRVRGAIRRFGIEVDASRVTFQDPFGFFDFVKLEQRSFCVLTDSGTVQEEACLFGVPNVTLRDVTERPETLEAGSNMLSGSGVSDIKRCVAVSTSEAPKWTAPNEYRVSNVASTVARIVTGFVWNPQNSE